MKKDKPYKLLTVQPGKFGNQRDMPYCRRKTERGRLPLPAFPLSWGGCGYTSASLVSVLSGCPYQGGFRKKSYGHKTYYFTDRKAGLTMYESPSVYGVHPFVRLTFLPSVQSVRPSVQSVRPSVQSINTNCVSKKACVGEKLMKLIVT